MRFLRSLLRVEPPSGLTLYPPRIVEVEERCERVFERCAAGIEHVLGGSLSLCDPGAGLIEASFGLVDSERLRVHLEPVTAAKTRVTIERRRGAIGAQPRSAVYVDALAEYLQEI